MVDSETTIELIRDVREILRDSARAFAAQAEVVAVSHDRLGRALEDNDRMKDILTRIDASLVAAEQAKSLAKANADLKGIEEKHLLLKVTERASAALSSSLGQRILTLLAYIILGWLGLRFGVVVPGPAVTPSVDVEEPAVPHATSEGNDDPGK